MSKVIGIDLGSTLSEAAVIENGKPVVVTNEEGSRTTPSVVSFTNDDRKIGAAAKRQQIVNPTTTVNLIKRFMGATYDEAQKNVSHVQYKVINNNGKAAVDINGKTYTPEEISAMILQKMKKTAEDYLGSDVKDAVITVPAYFNDAQRQATKNAGEIARLNVLRVISEPTAALLSSNIDMKKGGKFMVVDYGGATTDLSIADIGDGVVEILASDGNVFLGGSDIDKRLSDYIIEQFKIDNGVDLSKDTMAVSRIMEAAEKAKIELSNSSATDINLPYITATDKGPVHLTMNITRAKFEQLIMLEVDKVMSLGRSALQKANLEAKDLDGILIIGGSCRIPMIQQRLKEEFGDKLIKSSNLDLAVAEGAAIQADRIVNKDSKTGDIVLLDVTPLNLGIEVEGGLMANIVDANTTIPTEKSQEFTNASDSQTAITVQVYQGNRPMAKDNKRIGVFNLEGLIPAPRGTMRIGVNFSIDANGLLTVTATDKATNKEQKLTIDNSSSLSKEEIERMKAEAEANAEADKKEEEKVKEINAAQNTVYANQKLLKDNESKMNDDEKKSISEAIDALQKAVDAKNIDDIKSANETLGKAWEPVSKRIYAQQQADNNQQQATTDKSENSTEQSANGNANETTVDAEEV